MMYVSDEFFRELCDFWIEVVHDVVHDASGLFTFGRVHVEGIRLELVGRLEAVHVDVPIFLCNIESTLSYW